MKISSLTLKCALMYYFRFKRQYICVDECFSGFREYADILVDTGKAFREIEIKISKSDLLAEKKKIKHKVFKGKHKFYKPEWGANYFYICVPLELKEYAEKWIEEVNPKYGLITYQDHEEVWRRKWEDKVHTCRNAKKLHSGYNEKLKTSMLKRLSSALANSYAVILRGEKS